MDVSQHNTHTGHSHLYYRVLSPHLTHTHTADPIPFPLGPDGPSTAHHDDDARDEDENVDEIARGYRRARSRGQAIDRTVRRTSTASARPDRVTGHRHSFARECTHRIRIAGSYLSRIARFPIDRLGRGERDDGRVGRAS